ncbi:Hypothetical predicted protein [Paramuricea clavata]|uniref:Uncharacterized protein n=1 Tax=Paramuricea clavata TaxID=317549 RepID=A0A7D9IXR7_PARCT|nr:Hypothetical predicted protein [Paramuricea clavata]
MEHQMVKNEAGNWEAPLPSKVRSRSRGSRRPVTQNQNHVSRRQSAPPQNRVQRPYGNTGISRRRPSFRPTQSGPSPRRSTDSALVGCILGPTNRRLYLSGRRRSQTLYKTCVLSVTNSLYDPLGIAAPVVIKAKILLRAMTTSLKRHPLDDWDQPRYLSNIKHPGKLASRIEIHTFCDASTEAIAAVSYIKVVPKDGQAQVSFVFGKAKLAPPHARTIPRLELCAAVLGVEITELVIEELAVKPHSVAYYTDSKVTLGYILNETRRFYVYVSNRVQRIRRSSSPDQWRYVATDINPADLATRSVKACDLKDSSWLAGSKFLQSTSSLDVPPETETFLPHKKTQNFVPNSQPSPRTQSPEFRKTLELIASYASRGGQT